MKRSGQHVKSSRMLVVIYLYAPCFRDALVGRSTTSNYQGKQHQPSPHRRPCVVPVHPPGLGVVVLSLLTVTRYRVLICFALLYGWLNPRLDSFTTLSKYFEYTQVGGPV